MVPSPALPARPDRRSRGILLRIGAVTSFAGMGVALKIAADKGVDLPWLLFSRSIGALPVILLWLALGPGLGSIRTTRPMAHIVRSSLGFGGMVATIVSLMLLPLGDATALIFTAPIFATILSAVLLREKVGRSRRAAVAVGFVGVLLVTRPFLGGGVPVLGAAIAIAAAAFSAAAAITIRQIGQTENVGATVFWFMTATSTMGALALPFGHPPPLRAVWPFLAAAGLCGAVGQIFLTSSLRNAPVAVLAPLDYLQIAWAMLFGWLIWQDVPTAAKLGGAALIAISGLWTVWREQALRRGQVAATPPEE